MAWLKSIRLYLIAPAVLAIGLVLILRTVDASDDQKISVIQEQFRKNLDDLHLLGEHPVKKIIPVVDDQGHPLGRFFFGQGRLGPPTNEPTLNFHWEATRKIERGNGIPRQKVDIQIRPEKKYDNPTIEFIFDESWLAGVSEYRYESTPDRFFKIDVLKSVVIRISTITKQKEPQLSQ
jgi:hypothetical protein